jgi:chemotaxis protein MotB
LAAAVLAAACGVPKDKYNATLEELKQCQADSAACGTERDQQKTKIGELEQQITTLQTSLDAEKKARASAEATLAELQTNLQSTREELEGLRKARAEAEKRLAAFRALTAKFQKMIDSGKIKVQFRKGRMLVQLPSGVLFASGKADLSKEGKAALAEVATILKEFPDRQFLVAGHTDNVPPARGGRYKDNWELSTARAVTVTKFMVEQGMPPANLSAAGYGEYDPVGDNATEEGKQENRRIEMILLPNIEELPSMPEEPSAPATQPSG